MVTNISIVTNSSRSAVGFAATGHKVSVALPEVATEFTIEITFGQPIVALRSHDYKWLEIGMNEISGAFTPKILRLANKCFVQANRSTGVWVINQKNKNVLLWKFNQKEAAPLTSYTGADNSKVITAAVNNLDCDSVSLLFSFENAVEVSRSKIPFSAVACFTDHCDFDTAESLKLQRELFAETGVKVTKGFFLNQFSKREGNASYQNDAEELQKWRSDKHELAYHSLSQSIKPTGESLADFENFKPPFPDIPTWIDHGYQPYNLSLFENNGISAEQYEATLKSKNIKNLWNYIDSGTSSTGIINQLNRHDFTLERFAEGNKSGGFVSRSSRLIKNIVFHFYADEQIILSYKGIAESFKKIIYQKKIAGIFAVIRHLAALLSPLLHVFLNWNTLKKRPFRLAEYSPLYFRHTIQTHEFSVFQTLEMTNFVKSLCRQNLEKLVAESGIFIAHTYFSAPMPYHEGRMFTNPTEIDFNVRKVFEDLGNYIQSQKIWNPTLSELLLFLESYGNIVFDVDHEGKIIILDDNGVASRNVQ